MSNWRFPEKVIIHCIVGADDGLGIEVEQHVNANVKIEKELDSGSQELIKTNCVFTLEGDPDVEIGDYIEYDSQRYEVTFFAECRDLDGRPIGIRCTTK